VTILPIDFYESLNNKVPISLLDEARRKVSHDYESDLEKVQKQDESFLDQNIPNPATNSTSIGYRLPAEVKAAEPVSTDPFIYFVQAGAYRSNEEAQAQRAKTAMLGLDTKISERDQGGRTVYRVRVGPMDKAEAERVRAKLEAAHIDSAMVRVQR
jgi:cell division protein FtsN